MSPIFRGFCINRSSISPLHYILSRADFSFKFAEIFVIEKRHADSLKTYGRNDICKSSLPITWRPTLYPVGSLEELLIPIGPLLQLHFLLDIKANWRVAEK
jgi:hypothetical protein